MIAAEHIRNTGQTLAEVVAENCGKTVEDVLRDMDRDKWLGVDEAISYGIADKIIRSRHEE